MKKFLNMKRFFDIRLLAFLLLFPIYLSGCSETSANPAPDDLLVDFILPSAIETSQGGTISFEVKGMRVPSPNDNICFEASNGVVYTCPVTDITGRTFNVVLDNAIVPGIYKVSLKRDDRKRLMGVTNIIYVSDMDFTPGSESTIYGVVTDGNEPIGGAVISDGYEVVVTGDDGIYQMASDKKNGYVFISVPSGYEVESDGVVPMVYKHTRALPTQCERIDFTLEKVGNQNEYTLLICGDIHLANRTKDLAQFSKFTDEVNKLVQSSGNRRVYALTLGDMSWDIYWNDNKFGLQEYINTINMSLSGLQIFHTMGNHDNEYTATSDFAAGNSYRNIVAPTYYSFNIGDIHYIVLDNIDCSDYDGTTSRTYAERVTEDQFNWLEKDLQHVSKSTPIIVAMHAPLFKPVSGTSDFKFNIEASNANRLLGLLEGYDVDFVSGHSHLMFSAERGKVREHNSGAVCGSWWWSGYLTDGVHISPDGTPGGYGIWNVDGKNISTRFKAIGHDSNYQFRAYDLNKVSFSMSDVPQMPTNVHANILAAYLKYVNAYPQNNDNEVLINIWNWNPRWTVTVTTESGESISVKQVWAYDPLHIAAMSVKRFNSASLKSIPNFITEEYTHFFKVKAPDANCDLTITVTDDFGNIYKEIMKRPHDFIVADYKQKN